MIIKDWTFWINLLSMSSNVFFVYLKCKSVGYWYIVAICQNQLTIFIQARSTTIGDYPSINYLLQTLIFLAKIGIISIISGSKISKLNIFWIIFSWHITWEDVWPDYLFDILTLHSINFSSIPLINFNIATHI